MQFVVIAYDYKNSGLERRLAVREKHIKLAEEMRLNGQFIFGGHFRNEKNQMIGSIMFFEFPSRKELDDWLKRQTFECKFINMNIQYILRLLRGCATL